MTENGVLKPTVDEAAEAARRIRLAARRLTP
jgi:hypothetical protein